LLSEVVQSGRRLSAKSFTGAGVAARAALAELAAPKVPLGTLTAGHKGGVYRPSYTYSAREAVFVRDPMHGVPFVNNSAMMRADLSCLKLLSRRRAESTKLRRLRLERGMTLMSCSGAIGRMAYVGPDLDGCWSSQDIIKIRPSTRAVRAGYLHAFLSCRYGVALLSEGAYGAVIQHVERSHVIDLPVPRLGDELEREAHELVEQHALALADYSRLLAQATREALALAGLEDAPDHSWHEGLPTRSWTEERVDSLSLRAWNHDPRARRVIRKIQDRAWSPLRSVCDPQQFRGKIIFKRVDADPEFGVMLVGQRAAFQLLPAGRWISRKSVEGLGLVVPQGSTMIPSHGTLGEYELYCRAVFVTARTSQYAFSGDFFRCIPVRDRISPGYLHAFLRSRLAFRLLRSISTGSKQQEQHATMMAQFPVPRLRAEDEERVGAWVEEAARRHDEAITYLTGARALVERAIEGAT